MAELEVIKHTKKVYNIWGSKEHSVWHKVKEFILEVFIIVFAVSLSIWLHSWSEHKHEQKEVKHFLLGLRNDLKRDVEEMESDKKLFYTQQNVFSYIGMLKEGQPMSTDTFLKYQKDIFNLIALNPNNGRFEGFKSSGKIATIEQEELQDDIMDLYQEDYVTLLESTGFYNTLKRQIFDYVFANMKNGFAEETTDVPAVLTHTIPRNFSYVLATHDDIRVKYDRCLVKARKIIAQIDKEYGVKEDEVAKH